MSYVFRGTLGYGGVTNWAGPHSSAWGTAASNQGGTVSISNFDMSPSSGDTDVYNVGSSYGSDLLNLTAVRAGFGYDFRTTVNQYAFLWNGNALTPGPVIDTNTFASQAGVVSYTDTLAPQWWGLERDFELVLGGYIDSPNGAIVSVDGWADANVSVVSPTANIYVNGAMRGDIDVEGCGHAQVQINTSSETASGTESTFTIRGALASGQYYFYGSANTSFTNYFGQTIDLNNTGSGSLVNFMSRGGSDNVDVSTSQISSNLTIHGRSDSGDSLSFISTTGGASGLASATLTAGGSTIELNATGSGGAAHIVTSDSSGVVSVSGFVIGRDSVDMLLGGAFVIDSMAIGTGSVTDSFAATITDGNGHGIVLAGMFPESLNGHITTATVAGQSHLYIS